MYEGMKLVARRECGDCTLCCTVLTIDTPEIQKEAGATCRHCVSGCAIHDARPPVCSGFFCAWRILDILPADWRPDSSGIFAQLETEDIPPQFSLRTGIGLMLVGNPLKTLRERRFQEFIGKNVMTGIPLFLSLPGPRGCQASKIMLNTDEMRDAAASRVGGRIREELEKALKRLSGHDFKAHVMRHSGNNTGLAS